jgi:hypothetical protein
MPQGPLPTTAIPATSSFQNFSAANAGAQIKTGPGAFTGLSVNTAGTASTITLFDGTSTAGAKIGEFSTVTAGPFPRPSPIQFQMGLFAVVVAAADVTVLFR